MAEDTNYVTLEVVVESVLDREVEQALSETPVEVRDPQDEE